ncbi:hypothetical protein DPMN_098480 [Dreissena polymorpha]|uniref:Uncharacterized protein n=1 Tax=Dreissena polymorpha TaxID=45954 RepID=A0A9D4LC91_DREPO|nr:hypothetical protein DPMN_098480 [Dreissena polymorpha]
MPCQSPDPKDCNRIIPVDNVPLILSTNAGFTSGADVPPTSVADELLAAGLSAEECAILC